MKKRNGFTLIELLAVIVILSLIALIAIPMIVNVIESSRKGAYTESLRNLMKAVEYYETSEEILGRKVDFEEGISVFDSHIEMKSKNFIAGKIKKNENGELYLDMVSDGVYCGMGTIDQLNVIKGSCGELDTTVPNNIVITENRITSNRITVTVSVTTGHSGVRYYEYSMDGGITYLSSTNDSYTFTGLKKDTDYQIKVRVTSGNNLTGESEIKVVHTSDVEAPTYVVENANHWSTSKKVTITYPNEEGYTYEYSLDKGSTWVVAENKEVEVPFSSNGTLVARVTDGNNIVLGESMSVTKITGTELTDYIQDGLQVFYDGKNATGTGPNSNTSSTKDIWKDLSGNGRDGTLVDFSYSGKSGWVENGLSFGEGLDFVRIAPMNYDDITIESVIDVHAIPENTYGYIMANVQTGGYGLRVRSVASESPITCAARFHKEGITTAPTLPFSLNKIAYLAGRSNIEETILNYNDQMLVHEVPGVITPPNKDTYLVLGANPRGQIADDAEYLTDAVIYVARVYNRALTDDEIEKNYVIDKARYGF